MKRNFPSLFDAFEPVFGDPGKSSIDPPHPPIQGVKVSNLGMICNLKKEDSKRIGPLPHSLFPSLKITSMFNIQYNYQVDILRIKKIECTLLF